MIDPTARTLQWRRIVVESAAVVASILLAFAIDAWWDGHQAREREEDPLRGLLGDYRVSRSDLEARFELARRMAGNNALFEARLSESEATAALSVPDSLILGVIGGPTYEPATNTLDAALSSGEIELLRGDSLRAELANWRRMLIDTSEDELEVRRITNQQVVPALARSLSLGPYFSHVLAWSAGDPVAGLPVTPPSSLPWSSPGSSPCGGSTWSSRPRISRLSSRPSTAPWIFWSGSWPVRRSTDGDEPRRSLAIPEPAVV